jgi:mRNA interferase MazF
MIAPPFQWQVVRVALDPVRGSEQAGQRPALIVSHESCNTVLRVLTVLPMTTHQPGDRVYWNEVLLPAGAGGQPKPSIVMAHQVRTVAKERVLSSYGWLMDEDLRHRIREALRLYLDLG